MKLVLASGSKRRKELLSWLGLPFCARESGFDESGVIADDPTVLTSGLALAKAETVAEALKSEKGGVFKISENVGLGTEKEQSPVGVEPIYVLGADTIVYFEREVIGKPKDLDQAREVLGRLKGNTHQVYTGLAVVDLLSGKHKVDVEVSMVKMRDFSDEELEVYLATSEPLGKAGGYRLLGKGGGLVEEVSGSATNISGLPLLKVVGLFNDLGIKVEVDVVKTIERKTGYSA